MVAMHTNREDIDITLSDQRPPYKPQDLPHCDASDFKVPQRRNEAMAMEHAHRSEGSTARQLY